jgi:Ca2+-binding RTX toxin-like protein
MSVQRLEPRRLFAVSISVDAAQNYTITGTDGDDVVLLEVAQDNDLSINVLDGAGQTVGQLERDNIRSLVVNLRGGHDTFGIGDATELAMQEGEATVSATIRVHGGDGNDTLSARHRNTTLYGGGGNDKLDLAPVMYGESGNDVIKGYLNPDSGGALDEYIDGGSGNDTLDSNGGNDTILGGSGNDLIYVRDAYDTRPPGVANVDAGSGHDKVHIIGPADVKLGSGDDKAYVQTSPDYGEDRSYGTPIHATIRGGDGKDYIRIEFNAIIDPERGVQVYGDNHNDTLIGGLLDDSLYGGDGNDYINAHRGNDYVEGNDGNDTILGGAGNDELLGGAGADRIFGDAGRDTITGCAGADVLIADDKNLDTLYTDALDDITRRNVWDLVFI